jgi:hypothetical protein
VVDEQTLRDLVKEWKATRADLPHHSVHSDPQLLPGTLSPHGPLEALREQLRCKEIWVIGANRYRNPGEDLPADFELKREEYYKALNLPLDADRFITELQTEMCEALNSFDGGLKKNRCVRIRPKGGGWITLTPLDAQPDPPNLTALKTELNAIWPMTSLLDMVKETDLRLGFTDVLKSATAYEVLERSVLQPRLLLCLHGIGTNAGLQRMAGLESGVTAKDLAYVPPPLYQQRGHATPSNRDRCRRDTACPQSGNLGHRHNSVRIRFQTLRRLGSESHHAVACPLWRARHHDLLIASSRLVN